MSKRFSFLVLLVILIVSLIFLNPNFGEIQGISNRSTESLNAIGDTTIESDYPDDNWGSLPYLDVEYSDPNQSIILIKFDLSSLPSDAIVLDATMQLYFMGSTLDNNAYLEVLLITSPWFESTVTWNTALGLTTSPTGLIFEMDDNIGTWMNFDFMGSYVRTWLDDPSSNHGLMIRPSTKYGNFLRTFNSREANPAFVPRLEVTYYRESIYHQLSGRVYQGNVGDESIPIQDVKLDLYCSISPIDLGTWVDTAFTDSTGWYGLNGYYGCDYYNIVETDENGYVSTGATTVDGTVITNNRIQYQAPLSGQIHTGNKFWDSLAEDFNIFLPVVLK